MPSFLVTGCFIVAYTYLNLCDYGVNIHKYQTYNERINLLKAKINARNERIKLVIQRGTPDDDPLDT